MVFCRVSRSLTAASRKWWQVCYLGGRSVTRGNQCCRCRGVRRLSRSLILPAIASLACVLGGEDFGVLTSVAQPPGCFGHGHSASDDVALYCLYVVVLQEIANRV